jgi:hypothetical protein
MSQEVAAIRGTMQLLHQTLDRMNDLLILLSFKGYVKRPKSTGLAENPNKPGPDTPLTQEMAKFKTLTRRSMGVRISNNELLIPTEAQTAPIDLKAGAQKFGDALAEAFYGVPPYGETNVSTPT